MDVMATCSNKSSSLAECQFGKFRSKMATPFSHENMNFTLKVFSLGAIPNQAFAVVPIVNHFVLHSLSVCDFCTIEEFKVGATAKIFFQSQQGSLTHRVQTPLAAAPEALG